MWGFVVVNPGVVSCVVSFLTSATDKTLRGMEHDLTDRLGISTAPWAGPGDLLVPIGGWAYIPADSGVTSGSSRVGSCDFKTVCQFAIRERGRAQAVVLGPGGSLFVEQSPLVQLRPDTTAGDSLPDEVSITITVQTANPNASFTALTGENQIQLLAEVTPPDLEPDVQWAVEAAPGFFVGPLAPPTDLTGASQSFFVAAGDPTRWPSSHTAAINDLQGKQFGYRVQASVTDASGVVHESNEVIVHQDEIDTAREEYVEFNRRFVPQREEFTIGGAPQFPGVNGGDYQIMVFNGAFAQQLSSLSDAWIDYGFTVSAGDIGRWQLNQIYRSPVHNSVHNAGAPSSWHQYHCAADIQVFPVRDSPTGEFPDEVAREAAELFHTELRRLAKSIGFQYEHRTKSGIGHVHVELACRGR